MNVKAIVLAIAMITGIAILPAFFANMPSRIIDDDQLNGEQDSSPNNEVAGVNPEMVDPAPEVVDPALDIEVEPEVLQEEALEHAYVIQ